MTQDPTSNGQEIFEDMSNDLADTENSEAPGRNASRFPKPSPVPKIILGVGILLVIILLALFFRGPNGASKEDVSIVRNRLDQLEKRLASLDATEKKISSLENRFLALQQSVARFDSAEKSLREKVDKLGQQVERLTIPPPPPPAKATVTDSSQKPSTAQGGVRYHEVKQGETLYRIASKYNMTMDELRRLNNLKPNQNSIKPGQKLAVSPNRP
jgi:LysM repeat protein